MIKVSNAMMNNTKSHKVFKVKVQHHLPSIKMEGQHPATRLFQYLL